MRVDRKVQAVVEDPAKHERNQQAVSYGMHGMFCKRGTYIRLRRRVLMCVSVWIGLRRRAPGRRVRRVSTVRRLRSTEVSFSSLWGKPREASLTDKDVEKRTLVADRAAAVVNRDSQVAGLRNTLGLDSTTCLGEEGSRGCVQ